MVFASINSVNGTLAVKATSIGLRSVNGTQLQLQTSVNESSQLSDM